jgi:hypothetical protein
MTAFDSMTKALEGLFDRRLEELPDEQRGRVVELFRFRPAWNGMSPDQRRSVTVQSDFEEDPECESGRGRLFELFVQVDELQKAAAPTVLDIEARRHRIAECEEEIAAVDAALQAGAFARWVLAPDFPPARPSNSVCGERVCQRELEALMREFEAPPDTKARYMAVHCAKHKISQRGFERAWSNAIVTTNNTRWGRAGRPRKNPST